MKIYFRYILLELIKPFIFGVTAFTAIFVGTDILFRLADLYASWDIGFLRLIELFMLSLPQIIVYTFPMAALLSTILGYSRLTGDNEIIALRAGGFSITRLVVPALLIGLTASLGAIAINEYVVPRANYRYARHVHRIETGEELPRSQSDFFLTPLDPDHDGPDFVLYASYFNADTGEMTGVILQEFQEGRPHSLIEAESAIWRNEDWHFHRGRMFELRPGERIPQLDFDEYVIKADIGDPEAMAELDRDPDEMNQRELAAHIEALRAQGDEALEERVLWHQNFAIPFASFIFTLMAAPLGLRQHRGGSSATGMGLSVIIIFIYYGMMTLGDALGSQGTLPPWLGAWWQNLIFLFLGLIMLYRARK
ncbi:LptF/LptG family permease [Halarsenatibacter silvermanii]|uniref:Lipopolysaccharide export system permease protein n=1 Tax=Halarsenatibacter silvermanii TaxID=321763 RepID=A0A1G9HSE9_9FIRM|nr:LptF/LptG family permease [Halarsenatibacter silvermanii]SDL15746.1 lipopolysaccharide export system permease protein [Halarsenatibacter silvermanii]